MRRAALRPASIAALTAAIAPLVLGGCSPDGDVANPHPVHLVRPRTAPLSEVAQLGRAIFFDSTLSASGRLSCATCHDPADAFGPPPGTALRLLATGTGSVVRAVPSLRYLDRAPAFSIGPESSDADGTPPPPPTTAARAPGEKLASAPARPGAMVPRGGLFWDGRASTLQDQAIGPLTNPAEMANRDVRDAAARLAREPYAPQLRQIFGAGIFATPARAVDEAMFAVARYQIEDSSFHPYDSRYDRWLEGRATLTAAEARGLSAFEDTTRGNCAACHIARPSPDGLPPTFTDYEYEALGLPRNRALPPNRDSTAFDLGLCGPLRTDLRDQAQYCGLFITPSLRNVADRTALFHNGVYHSLDQALAFYALRDVTPDSIYRDAHGNPDVRFNDLPARYRGNVDTIDPPFGGHAGAWPRLTPQDRRDIVAFLRTLSDGSREPISDVLPRSPQPQ